MAISREKEEEEGGWVLLSAYKRYCQMSPKPWSSEPYKNRGSHNTLSIGTTWTDTTEKNWAHLRLWLSLLFSTEMDVYLISEQPPI